MWHGEMPNTTWGAASVMGAWGDAQHQCVGCYSRPTRCRPSPLPYPTTCEKVKCTGGTTPCSSFPPTTSVPVGAWSIFSMSPLASISSSASSLLINGSGDIACIRVKGHGGIGHRGVGRWGRLEGDGAGRAGGYIVMQIVLVGRQGTGMWRGDMEITAYQGVQGVGYQARDMASAHMGIIQRARDLEEHCYQRCDIFHLEGVEGSCQRKQT